MSDEEQAEDEIIPLNFTYDCKDDAPFEERRRQWSFVVAVECIGLKDPTVFSKAREIEIYLKEGEIPPGGSPLEARKKLRAFSSDEHGKE